MNKFTLLIVTWIIKFLKISCRYQRPKIDARELAKQAGFDNHCYAVWHQNIVATTFSFFGENVVAMVSQSKDGQIATDIAEKLGFEIVRGSASRGGKKALLQLIRRMKVDKVAGAITVDGPRGPKYEVKPGILELAKLTNTCIIPIVCYPTSKFVFERSWDHFRLPKPFSKIIIKMGEPLPVPKEFPKENFPELQEKLKHALLKVEQEIINELN